MRRLNLITAALIALASPAFTMQVLAEEPAKSGQGESGNSQNSSSNSPNQNQTKNNDNKGNTDPQSDNSQSSPNDRDSQDQSTQQTDQPSSQDRSNRQRDDRENTNSKEDRRSSDRDRDNSTDRDAARSDRDDRTNPRDRSTGDADRDDNNRGRNLDRDSSREHSRQDNMRGPDIGIWFSRPSRDGLVISDVSTRGPIAKLGFREGDRIVSVNGQRVTSEDEFMRYLLRTDSRRVTVIVFRDNREETIYVEPAVLIDDSDYVEVDPLERFGIILDDRYDDRIVVWRVTPRSPAYYAGFRPGDVIVTFSGRPYRTRTEFETGSRTWKTGDADVQIRRGDRTRDLSVQIPNFNRSDRRSERSPDRNARTAQRDDTVTDQNNQNSNDQRRNNNGGILNNIRPRGNR